MDRRVRQLDGIDLVEAKRVSRYLFFCRGLRVLVPVTWSGAIFCRGETFQLSSRELFVAPPGEICIASASDAGELCMLGVESRAARALLKAAFPALDPDCSLLPVTDADPQRRGRIQELIGALRAPDCSSLSPDAGAVLSTLAALLKPRLSAGDVEEGDDLAALLRLELQSDPSCNISIESIAREFGASRHQALRAFRQRYGVSPRTFRICFKVALAQEALHSHVKLAQLATDFGFFDQSHLCRHFKTIVGQTPASYAAQNVRRERSNGEKRRR